LNRWKEQHLLEARYHCSIGNIGKVSPDWRARPFRPRHCQKLKEHIISTETVSEHLLMLATAKSKGDDGKFDWQKCLLNKDLAPMAGQHTSEGLRDLSVDHAAGTAMSEGLIKTFTRIEIRILFVDTDSPV
jgi:hypothetical protein